MARISLHFQLQQNPSIFSSYYLDYKEKLIQLRLVKLTET